MFFRNRDGSMSSVSTNVPHRYAAPLESKSHFELYGCPVSMLPPKMALKLRSGESLSADDLKVVKQIVG